MHALTLIQYHTNLFQLLSVTVDCPPGLYGELENGKATCKLCPVGFYQINSGQTSCTKCQEGHTTIGQGSYDKNQCKAKGKHAF